MRAMARPLPGSLEFDVDADGREDADRGLLDNVAGLLIELDTTNVLSARHILYVDIRDQLPAGEEPTFIHSKVECEEER